MQKQLQLSTLSAMIAAALIASACADVLGPSDKPTPEPTVTPTARPRAPRVIPEATRGAQILATLAIQALHPAEHQARFPHLARANR